MTRLQIIFLSIAFIHFGMLSAIAAEGDNEAMAADTQMMENEVGASDTRMIRETSPVVGYQPLTVAGQEIAATYLEETLGERHGAIIFFHDQGEQFESQGVVTPLRHAMLKHGWSTLTLQLDYPFEPSILLSSPDEGVAEKADVAVDEVSALVADALAEKEEESKPAETPKDIGDDISKDMETTSTDALPPISNKQRIDAAVASLQARDIKQIVFLGHGSGGEMAVELLENTATSISALVLAGTPGLTTDQVFETLSFPILDIYGDLESDTTVSAIKHRKIVMKRSGNTQYAVREVLGANHQFYGLQARLELTLHDWLKKTFVEQEAQ